jgi:UDP-glucose/iron transport system ATP-binding protein
VTDAEGAAGPRPPPPSSLPQGEGGSEPTLRLRTVSLRNRLAGPFDLELAAGECLAITGPSGSGKSLSLRMIADLDPNEGEVFLDGASRHTFHAPAWRRKVLYSAAEPGWWHERAGAHFRGEDLAFARATLPRLGLEPGLLDSPVVRLSTGERQRMALIRALALHSPVLLLDEPTGALDQESTALVEDVLRERLAAGTTIVMVTHSLAQAERLGHRQMRMENRHLVPP